MKERGDESEEMGCIASHKSYIGVSYRMCIYATPEHRNNSSAVVGAVLGTLTVVLIITVTIIVTVLFILSWRVSLNTMQCIQYYGCNII